MTALTLAKFNQVAAKYPDKDLGQIIGAIVDLLSPGESSEDKLDMIVLSGDVVLNEILDYMITGKVPEKVKWYNPWLVSWIKP